MNSVRCPICEQRIRAGDSVELSAMLREHLSIQHDIDVQEKSARFSSPMTSAQERSGRVVVNEPKAQGGLRGAEHRREEQYWAPESGTAVPPRPKGVGDWVSKSLGTNEEAGGREEWASGEGYPNMMQRFSPGGGRISTVECPMCGETITGQGDEGLSDSLEDHFRMVHHIEPRLVSR
jgi:predicted small metal-binding protein